MSTITTPLPTPPDNFSTQIASATVSSSAITFNVDDASGLPTEGVGVLFKKDSSGDIVAGSIEFIHWTSVSGNTINLSDVGDRGLTGSDSGAQSYVADDYFEVWVSSYYYDSLYDHFPTGDVVGTSDTQTLTNKTLTSPTINTPTVTTPTITSPIFRSINGWVEANETWTYSAWDDTNGVSTATITVPTDATTKYQPGMRIKFDQTTDGTKYGIITAVASTSLTVFMNTDYDFDNETITNPYYSSQKIPFGFDADPLKWQVEFTDTSQRTQGSPTTGTWYNPNSTSIDIPVGAWDVEYFVMGGCDYSTTVSALVKVALSTSASSVSDASLEAASRHHTVADFYSAWFYRRKTLTLSAKDTYYLIISQTGQSPATSLSLNGNDADTEIRAVCAYL